LTNLGNVHSLAISGNKMILGGMDVNSANGAKIFISACCSTSIVVHTVHFDANGGTGLMADQSSNTPVALSANTFLQTGYTFLGWNTSANGGGSAYSDGAIYSFVTDTTMYAQWTPEIITHIVHFDANGGNGTMSDQSSSIPATLNLNSFIRIGYTFLGWNTSSNGSGVSYFDGAVYSFTADTTLYAQWTPESIIHTVFFDANGGNGTMGDQSSSTPAVLNTNTFFRTGYSFSGWNTNSTGNGSSFADGAIYSFSADLILYAQWMSTTCNDCKENDDNIEIYPNPSSEYLIIENIPIGSGIQITNALGQIVYLSISTGERETICTTELVDGIYFVSIENIDKLFKFMLFINK
jgi:uncharacterized repeat protein (TIGR02543 family)